MLFSVFNNALSIEVLKVVTTHTTSGKKHLGDSCGQKQRLFTLLTMYMLLNTKDIVLYSLLLFSCRHSIFFTIEN